MATTQRTPAVSVVVPAHNEAGNLAQLVAEIDAALAGPTHGNYELIVIDDRSTDGSWELLGRLAGRFPSLRPRRMARQGGQSAALVAGFDLAAGAVVVTLDADLQNDPADIPALLAELDRADVAVGWRRDRKDTLGKRVISRVANAVRRWMVKDGVRDTGCGLKAFRREAIAHLPRFTGMHRFFPALVLMQGFSVAEVPVRHRPRTSGKTHYNLFNRSVRPIMDLFAVRWLQARAIRYELEKEAAVVRHAA